MGKSEKEILFEEGWTVKPDRKRKRRAATDQHSPSNFKKKKKTEQSIAARAKNYTIIHIGLELGRVALPAPIHYHGE